MRRLLRLAVALGAAAALLAVLASGASARELICSGGDSPTFGSPSIQDQAKPFDGNGLGPLTQATSSQAALIGGADLSDGTNPAPGGAEGCFLKGSETYSGSTRTTVIDFSLPPGVTVHSDPEFCGFLGNPGNYCIAVYTGGSSECTPDASNVVNVSGSEIEFRLACAQGQGFFWDALLDSLISTSGFYDTSVQFKVKLFKRVRGDMWQIKLPSSFEVANFS